MAVSSAIASGQRIGRYEVIKHLATGGMAEIYLARMGTLPGTDKLVVLKRILPELAGREDIVQMFLDEARIATLLDHPNVVQTFDAGVIDGKPYLAMEYLHGAPVSALLATLAKRGEKLPLEHALGIVIGVCGGLHYAHEKVGLDGRALNIVHRDVGPQNVVVTYDGGVKLVDFGIARSAHKMTRTRFGTIKGKVPYMSPEQCRNETLDRRSDIFSLGILIYELTLMRRLYRGQSDYDVLKQIVEGKVAPPRTIDPDYDPALEAIVMRALEKDRDARPATARELQGELEAVARALHLATSPLGLQQLMERCFGARIQVLRDAQARDSVELLSLIVDPELASYELDELAPSQTAEVAAPVDEASTWIAAPAAARVAAPRRWRRAAGWVAAIAGAAVLGSAIAAAAFHFVRRPVEALPPPVALAPQRAMPSPPSTSADPVTARADTPASHAEPPAMHAEAPASHAPAPAGAPATERAASAPAGATKRPAATAHAIRTPPRPPHETGTGMLVLASSPWCRVTIDGADRGPTPVRLELPAGPHVVELSNSEFHIARRLTVAIHANETVRKNLDFGE